MLAINVWALVDDYHYWQSSEKARIFENFWDYYSRRLDGYILISAIIGMFPVIAGIEILIKYGR